MLADHTLMVLLVIDGLNQGNVKTPFYIPFGNPAQKPNLFNAVDDVYHGQLRRWAGNVCTSLVPAYTIDRQGDSTSMP